MCFDPVSLSAMAGSLFAGGGAAAGTAAGAAATGWGTLGTIATVGSGLVSTMGMMQQGKAAAAAANATAQQQELAAQQTLEASDRELTLLRRQQAQVQGGNRVALAAAGVDVNSQEAMDLLNDYDLQADEDAFVIRENSLRAARGYGQQAANSRLEGANAKSRSRYGAAGTILETATKVGDRWKPYVYEGRMKAEGGY